MALGGLHKMKLCILGVIIQEYFLHLQLEMLIYYRIEQ